MKNHVFLNTNNIYNVCLYIWMCSFSCLRWCKQIIIH